MTRALVFGASGQAGWYLTKQLLEEGKGWYRCLSGRSAIWTG
jgi:GDP-D-mannose dehydratase